TARDAHGGIYSNGTALIAGSTVSANTALGMGGNGFGGLSNFGRMTVINSTVTGNRTRWGFAGIASFGSVLTLSSSTITDNSAGSDGGGLIAHVQSRTFIRNTLVAGNRVGPGGAGPDVEGRLNSQGHNLIGIGDGASGYAPTDLVGTQAKPLDPRLAPPAH